MGEQTHSKMPEPWLRGTHTDLPIIVRAVTHALELADEEVDRWCTGLSNEQMQVRPLGLESISFQILHMAGSVDRLLTYAEGRTLSTAQRESLTSELHNAANRDQILAAWKSVFVEAVQRLLRFSDFEASRSVGSKRLPSTVGSLLIHIADHTQRHVGQMIATAKVLRNSTAW